MLSSKSSGPFDMLDHVDHRREREPVEVLGSVGEIAAKTVTPRRLATLGRAPGDVDAERLDTRRFLSREHEVTRIATDIEHPATQEIPVPTDHADEVAHAPNAPLCVGLDTPPRFKVRLAEVGRRVMDCSQLLGG